MSHNNSCIVCRGEYKVPGGKLVAVQVSIASDDASATENCTTHESASHARQEIRRIRLDGDFFIDGVEDPSRVVEFIEHALLGVSAKVAMEAVHKEFPKAQFVGLTAEAIDIAISRALHDQGNDSSQKNSGGSSSQAIATSSAAGEKITQLSSVWDELDIAIIGDDIPRSPAMHMALDETLAREVADGTRGATLRFWQWQSNAVIIGIHQSLSNEVNMRRARELGFSVVRRVTGGGAMFVEPGNTITYSLYVPSEFLSGLSGYEAYKRCDEWALLALNNLGIDARYKAINDITSPSGKIGGAAQRQYRARVGTAGCGCILHHVTMAYDIDAAKMLDVLRISREKSADKVVKSAAKRVDPLKSQTNLSRDELYNALVEQAQEILPHSHTQFLSQESLETAEKLATKVFEPEEWTGKIS
ncbi:lipoate--protein ligase family protein [Alloscardovia theropitheci]|uniref:Lipoate--protein ligase family protein n=1 Tax=Alloscardovia theropitheci TaxID=2496842 RepID=A0A4R0QY50_9BIFI|nr:biotin/lipoate A/B protein ligase family protein [Alloscardovia theropitheci]TCD54481.1 lipoate--protein ligase family protein [Alloscardovia theropitheci]